MDMSNVRAPHLLLAITTLGITLSACSYDSPSLQGIRCDTTTPPPDGARCVDGVLFKAGAAATPDMRPGTTIDMRPIIAPDMRPHNELDMRALPDMKERPCIADAATFCVANDNVCGVVNLPEPLCDDSSQADCGACPNDGICVDNFCQACQPSSDEDACITALAAADAECGSFDITECGEARSIECMGSCTADQQCNKSNATCCTPEPDEELCEGLAATCGVQAVVDACGINRSPDCGQCAGGMFCVQMQCEATTIVSASTNTDDEFGHAVAFIDRSTLLVGAPGLGDGEVFVYRKDAATGQWREFATLPKPTDVFITHLERFGGNIAVDRANERVIVSARMSHIDEGTPRSKQGLAAIYTRAGSTFTLDHVMTTPTQGNNNDRFGTGVAILGEWALIGAIGANGSNKGRVYAYHLNAGAWSYQASLDSLSPANHAWFGASIDLHASHNTYYAVIGEPTRNDDTNHDGVHLFTLDTSQQDPMWTHQEEFQPEGRVDRGSGDPAAPGKDRSGVAVQIADGLIAFGADDYDQEEPQHTHDHGIVILYNRNQIGDWERSDLDGPLPPEDETRYGFRLSLDGDIIAVTGANKRSVNYSTPSYPGFVWYGRLNAGRTNFASSPVMLTSPNMGDVRFGESLDALDHANGQGLLAIGAPGEENSRGTVYLYAVD